MKKIILSTVFCFLVLAFCFSHPVSEQPDSKIRLAVMQGPTGFSSVMLGDGFEISVYPSPNEAVARLVKGELDMAVLPANAALSLYNKGVPIKAVAVVGEGMLSLIGTNESASKVSVPGAGGTPDHMARLLYSSYEPDYSVTAPAQLAQLLIAGKTELAILPEPFVTMVLSKNNNVRIISNVQQKWKELTGFDSYPMSILVASEDFVKSNREGVSKAAEAYSKSVDLVNKDPHEAALKIEQIGIMAASVAESAIPNCALVFLNAEESKPLCNSYFDILFKLDPGAVGNKTQDSDFWV